MNITLLQHGDIIHIHAPETPLNIRRIIAQKLQAMSGHPAIVTGQPLTILRPAGEPAGEPPLQAASQPEESEAKLTPDELEALDQVVTLCQKITGRSYAESRATILSLFSAHRENQTDPHPSLATPAPQPGTLPDPIPITCPGYHRESGLWFFADSVFCGAGCVYALNGKDRIEPGSVIGIQGTRYLIRYDTKTAPLMLPREETRAGALDTLLASLHKTHGTAAYLAIGGIIAYAFTPETLLQYNAAPGIWIHGRMDSGKSTMARILMELWGMDTTARFDTSNASPVSIGRLLGDFSSLPVHFDNYRQGDTQIEHSILRGCFNRQSTSKGRLHSSSIETVTPRTSPLITGEGKPDDAAIASRYIMLECVRTSPGNVSHTAQLLALAHQCRLIPRLFAAGRDRAAETFMRILHEWLVDTAQLGNDRQRLVIGIAFAAFATVIGEESEHTGQLKAHAIGSLSDPHPSVATPAPQPELPPLGHNLTFPKEYHKIKQLGHLLHKLRRILSNEEFDTYRRLALKHNRSDIELFDCILAFHHLGHTGQHLRDIVEKSLAAANLTEKSSEETTSQP